MAKKIIKIVLTGAPCGGKTSAKSRIMDYLADRSIKCFFAPEVATLFYEAGISLRANNYAYEKKLQLNLSKTIIGIEKAIENMARLHDSEMAVIVCDRGLLDVKAFCSPQAWSYVTSTLKMNEGMLKARYDAVFHLVTAADGAEEFYTLENNAARLETPLEARAIDKIIKNAWLGHPHLRYFDNRGKNFADKLRQVILELEAIIGRGDGEDKIEYERKFRVNHIDLDSIEGLNYEKHIISQTYLTDGSRVRMRTAEDIIYYTHTIKMPNPNGEGRYEKEAKIDSRKYKELLAFKDKSKETIVKERSMFEWDGLSYELDRFISPPLEHMLLEIELASKDVIPNLPPFLENAVDVTEDPKWHNENIAKIKRTKKEN